MRGMNILTFMGISGPLKNRFSKKLYEIPSAFKPISKLFSQKKSYIPPETRVLDENQLSPMLRLNVRHEKLMGVKKAIENSLANSGNHIHIGRINLRLKHELTHSPVHSQPKIHARPQSSYYYGQDVRQPVRSQSYYNELGNEITNEILKKGRYSSYNPRTGNTTVITGVPKTYSTTVNRGKMPLIRLVESESFGFLKYKCIENLNLTFQYHP